MNDDHRPTPNSLRVHIHRGADEIGGNCVELAFGDAHLIVDLGRPLGAKPGEVVPLPPIPGLTEPDPRLVGVVLSHPHEDHVGQVRALGAHVPVYLGAAAERILREATRWTPGGLDVRAAGHLEHRRPLQIGPFTVTPYRVDHSAYDAFALLIEAGGHRVFYSGDLRAHGRTVRFAELLRDGPRDVDVMLLEGTHVAPVGAHPARGPGERDVERACLATFRRAPGIAVTCFSAQNIDRLVSIDRAARRAGRELVLDLYTASIAMATGRATIPQPGFDGLRVYVRQHERRTVIARRAFACIDAIRAYRIFPEELVRRRRALVIVGRDSVLPELDRAGVLTDATTPRATPPSTIFVGSRLAARPPHRCLDQGLGARGVDLAMIVARLHVALLAKRCLRLGHRDGFIEVGQKLVALGTHAALREGVLQRMQALHGVGFKGHVVLLGRMGNQPVMRCWRAWPIGAPREGPLDFRAGRSGQSRSAASRRNSSGPLDLRAGRSGQGGIFGRRGLAPLPDIEQPADHDTIATRPSPRLPTSRVMHSHSRSNGCY